MNDPILQSVQRKSLLGPVVGAIIGTLFIGGFAFLALRGLATETWASVSAGREEKRITSLAEDAYVLMPINVPETAIASSSVQYVPVPLGDALVALGNQQGVAQQQNLQELAGYLTERINLTCKPVEVKE